MSGEELLWKPRVIMTCRAYDEKNLTFVYLSGYLIFLLLEIIIIFNFNDNYTRMLKMRENKNK